MIDIILVEPQISENIGAVARSMKVFGFSRLVLINPPDGFFDRAIKTAGKASVVLNESIVYQKFYQICESYDILVGTTRRLGGMRYPVYTPSELSLYVQEYASCKKVGIVFGRENRGLYNEEIMSCRVVSTIPSADAQVSLNLSHAVTIYLSEFHNLFSANKKEKKNSKGIDPATDKEIKELTGHIFNTLKQTQFVKYGDISLQNSLFHCMIKPVIEKKDVKLLHAIWYHLEKLINISLSKK